ncbi:MAG: NB-ARC domain-containing protein, partial [Acidimicrobiia bacterium]|nr:NB-ARC domain-containing protein [Acidimicrobiia bacterium]
MVREGPARRAGGDLPVQLSRFVGRTAEIDEVAAAVERGWLTSVVGTAGLGKTRLATEVASGLAGMYAHGVRVCDLATVEDPGKTLETIGTALRLRPSPGMSPRDAIVDALLGREMLLVLDNCEHVLGPVAELVVEIGSTAPTVRVLITSRERLGVSGEQVIRPGPLSESAELFAERARASGADVSSDNQATIARICEKVDGLPLAVELVSAKRRTMTLDEIERGLDDLARLVGAADLGGATRHRTLDEALAWSYELLDERERHLFDQLAVFSGSFDAATALAIVERPDGVDGPWEPDLGTLVDKSMLSADLSGATSRYRLLEAMRQYARRQLDPDEMDHLRSRHLGHFRQRAMAAIDETRTGEADQAYRWVSDNWAELREATAWATRSGDLAAGADLVAAGHEFGWWASRAEVGQWAERLLAAGSEDLRVHGTAAFWLAMDGDFVGQYNRVAPLLERNDWAVSGLTSWLWTNFASGLQRLGERHAARRATRQSYEANKLESAGQQAHWAAGLATVVATVDPGQAAALVTEACELIAAGRVAPHWQATALAYAARALATLGRASEARELNERATEIARIYDVAHGRVIAAATLAALAARGMVDDPRAAFSEALTAVIDAGDWYGAWLILEEVSRWWAASGNDAAASKVRRHLALWGALRARDEPVELPTVPLPRGELIAFVFAELDPAGPDGSSATSEAAVPLLRRSGNRWRLAWDGCSVLLAGLVGMDYLRQLLDAPDMEIAAATLAGGAALPRASQQAMFDRRARAEIEARSLELVDLLERARRAGDHARIAELEDEAERLVAELERSTGIGGRSRTFSDADERARTAVGKAIRRALDEIGRAHPAAAAH